jgi:PAS domain S-box-containing protein
MIDKSESTFWAGSSAYSTLDEIAKTADPKEAYQQAMQIWFSMMKNAAEVICIVEADGTIVFINRDIPGVPREQLIGRSMYDFVSPEYHARMKEALKKSFDAGKHSEFTNKAPLTAESLWWFSSRMGPVMFEDKIFAVCCMIRNITRRVEDEAALKKVHEELELKVAERTKELFQANEQLKAEIQVRQEAEKKLHEQTESLEEMNAALKILLKKRDEDKKEFEEKMLLNMKELVEPYLQKLKKSTLTQTQRAHVCVVEENLKDIASPFLYKYVLKYTKLTPQEIRVANLVKHGRTTKEISETLNLSQRTIDNHRRNIRIKLGLRHKKANMRSHLLAIQ